MNLCLFEGRIVDAQNKGTFTIFTVAVNEYFVKDGEKKQISQFIDCITFQNIDLNKGDLVSVRGKWNKYKNNDKYYTNIKVDCISFLPERAEKVENNSNNARSGDEVPF